MISIPLLKINNKRFRLPAAYCLILLDGMYIGTTNNLQNRIRQHRQCAMKPYSNEAQRSNPYLYEAMSKQGLDNIRVHYWKSKDYKWNEFKLYNKYNFGVKNWYCLPRYFIDNPPFNDDIPF